MGVVSAIAHIDLAAFEHNVRSIVSSVKPAATWIAVKANAYGHGMSELVDNALDAGAHGCAVLDIESALTLRSAGVAAPLFAWLHGAHSRFADAVAQDIDLGISTREQLDRVAAVPGVARVHLKIDTGLHRNGFSEADWQSLCDIAAELERRGSIRVVGVWSHLADAGPEHDRRALVNFDRAIDSARAAGLSPDMCHIAASSAALSEPESRHDGVRVGIAAYGISPFDDRDGRALGLRPVMTLTSEVIEVRHDGAIIGAGWADGVPVGGDNGGEITISQTRYAVRAVHARTTEIELDTTDVRVGMSCIIFGEGGATAEEWAAWMGTIGDEIVTSVPSSVRRVYA
ncbi:alanine racemase [Microbacteriaceae bacterium MWH-Ta3]|nr:alanine racemase [Microbacteriaceae bacterium MWH-Ta3]